MILMAHNLYTGECQLFYDIKEIRKESTKTIITFINGTVKRLDKEFWDINAI